MSPQLRLLPLIKGRWIPNHGFGRRKGWFFHPFRQRKALTPFPGQGKELLPYFLKLSSISWSTEVK